MPTKNKNNSLVECASLKKKNRLLDKKKFDSVFQSPSKTSDKYFTLLFCKNNKSYSRLGLVISKKKCKLAVNRNKIKRIIRESFRTNKNSLNGYDVVVLNKHTTYNGDSSMLRKSLKNHWQKIQG
ncbi:MAG: ribonuclease P protein component [Gammaproteobacteria bacterium]|nr:MAG: ribonuclease P protein component [Gammaproteobacteria bacterium]